MSLQAARIVVLVSVLLNASGSLADSLPPLTEESIQNFLQSIDEVRKLGEKYGVTGQDGQSLGSFTKIRSASMVGPGGFGVPDKAQLARVEAPISLSLPEMRASDGYGEMVAAVKRHGFRDVEDWAMIGDRAVRAYAAIQMEAEMPRINAQMKQMRENLAKSGMPAARQEAMLKMMQPGADAMKNLAEAPAEDKQAIKPFAAQFKKLAETQR
jgi:hypothetical protein